MGGGGFLFFVLGCFLGVVWGWFGAVLLLFGYCSA